MTLNFTLKFDLDEIGCRCAARTLDGLHFGAKILKIGQYFMGRLRSPSFDLEFNLEVKV